MTKQKSTKRALLASVLSLVLCISMLVGSTFAWFTDSATTGVNKIVSGNLDIVLEYRDENGDWKETDANTKLFDDAALWEPGYTEVVYLKVTNKGSLALNYQLAVNVAEEVAGKNVLGESFKLSDYIKFGKVISKDEITAYATREEAQAAATDVTTLQSYNTTEALLSGESTYIALVVYMPTTVGNEANHDGINVPSVKLGVSVFATQTPYEADSYGDDYDANAKNEPIVFTSDATYTVVGLTANGSNGVLQATNGATLTINGSGTVNAEEADDGYAMAVWANGGNVVIESGNFEQTITGTETQYDLIYASNGGNITIKGGTFKSVTPQWTLNVKDADRATSHITVMGGRFYQFDPSNAQTGEGEISVPEGFAVVKDGDWYEVVDERIHIENLADLKAFRDDVNAGNNYAGKIVVLDNDIDLANEAWTPIGGRAAANKILGTTGNQTNKAFSGIFDGQGHTISNLNITYTNTTYSAENCEAGLFGNIHAVGGEVNDGTVRAGIKNLTIDNAKVTGSENVGVIVGTITGQEKNANGANTHHGIIMQNLKVTGHVEVNGDHDVGTIAGHANGLRIFDGNNNQLYGAENLVVDVDDTSYIKASVTMNDNWAKPQNGTRVGGVIGNLGYAGNHMTGRFKMKDISSNINVTGANSAVGGLFGWIGDNPTLENVSCSGNVTLIEAGTDYVSGGSTTIAKWNTAGGICGRRMDKLTVTSYSFTGTVTITDADSNTLTHTNTLWDTFGASIQADGENTGANAVLNVTNN